MRILTLETQTILLSALLALAGGQPSQLPHRLDNCLPYPTFAQEIRQANEEAGSEQPNKPVRIKSLRFNSDQPLPAISDEIASETKANAKIQDGPDWPLELEEIVRDAWQHRGYFKVHVEFPDVNIVRDTEREQVVGVTIKLDSGKLYRTGDLQFSESTIASPEQLRSLFPIGQGDVFDTHKLSEGIEALRSLYAERGLINFAAVPSFQIDEPRGFITLVIDFDEGNQFRVGTFRILGLEPALAQKLVAESGLASGSIFNPRLLKEFFQTNRSVLPPDANEDNDVERRINENEGTVDITINLQTCP